MKEAQRGKPYYIPAKNELLQYADEHYYEKNDSFIALREFLLQHMKLPLERAEDIADELQLHASTAESTYSTSSTTCSAWVWNSRVRGLAAVHGAIHGDVQQYAHADKPGIRPWN